MNTGYSSRGRTVLSAIAAVAITTVLVATLAESFDPMQLIQLQDQDGQAQFASVDSRKELTSREV